MCGIAGFSLSEADKGLHKSRTLTKKLLLEIMNRGTDATGVAWADSATDEHGKTDDALFYMKDDITAREFVEHLSDIPNTCGTAILHTRYATKGSPDNNDNNHPIVIPTIVGVHNGHIRNDDEIIEHYGAPRVGEVDSEAIFHLLSLSDEPLEELTSLQGRASIGWIRTDKPDVLHVARVTGSPLAVGWTQNDSFVFASTENSLRKAVADAGLVLRSSWSVPEYRYMKVKSGRVVEMIDLTTMRYLGVNRELFI